MARAGTPPPAVVGTQTRGDLLRALPRLARRLRGWRVAAKGASLLVELRRHGVRRITGATDLAVPGRARAEALGYRLRGREHRIACGTVLLHQGVVPNVQASRALRLAHRWDDGQRTFLPVTDAWGETSRPALFVAGDGAGISGALAAEAAGRLPGLQVAHRLGPLDADARDRVAANARRRLAAGPGPIRPFLDAAFPVPPSILRPADATIICRCEEVTAGQLRGWARMLQAVVWLSDMADFDEMNAVGDAWVPADAAPARACGEARLARSDLKVEIIVTATTG